MKHTTELDELTGKMIHQAFALHHRETGALQMVVFQVEHLYLTVAVDAATDEIVLNLLPALDLGELAQRYSSTPISNQRKKISATWRMTNSWGYEDGFQIELDDVESTNVQLLAEGAQLRLSIFKRF
ncbi:DUF6334 family protein [Pontibacter sp. CAU 1760]